MPYLELESARRGENAALRLYINSYCQIDRNLRRHGEFYRFNHSLLSKNTGEQITTLHKTLVLFKT